MGCNLSQQQKFINQRQTTFVKELGIYHLDKVLQYRFQFHQRVHLNHTQSLQGFFNSNQTLQIRMGKHLANMVQGICSHSFDIFSSNKCTKYQAFNYASKNILENLKSLISFVSVKLKLENSRKKKLNQRQIYQILTKIIDFIFKKVQISVETIFPKYPKTQVSGYSQKLKNAIKKTDYRQDYRLQTLFINKRAIIFPEQGINRNDYFLKQIKEFLNVLIKNPPKYEEAFNQLNRKMAWITFQTQISVNQITTIQKVKQNQNQSQSQNSEIMNFLIEPQPYQNKKTLQVLQKLVKFPNTQQNTQQKFLKKIKDDIQAFIKKKYLLLNLKIAKNTKAYNNKQLNENDFKIKSSPLLRVLTKWIQDIAQTLKKSQKFIRDNDFRFKNNKNEPIQLSREQRMVLYQCIKDQYAIILQNNKNDQKISNNFLSDAFSQQSTEQQQYYFQNSLKISSKLNAYIQKKTFLQLIDLFQKLLTIPNKAAQKYEKQFVRQEKQQNWIIPKDQRQREEKMITHKQKEQIQQLKSVNLICNRVGDLLRSTIYCNNQIQFIKLLKLLDTLDHYCRNKKTKINIDGKEEQVCYFRLIRIKNNLDMPINNVLINYMFQEKIQCELQIYFFIEDKNLQKASSMHHFLYQLKRGRYGIIAELTNIVNQNDPISLYHALPNLKFQKYPQKLKFKYFEKRSYLSISQEKQQIWKCINKFCNEFFLYGHHKFIKIQKLNGYCCFRCYSLYYSVFLSKTINLFNFLSQFQYQEDDRFVRQLIKLSKTGAVTQISQNLQKNHNYKEKDIYLVIYPTEKKIIVEFKNFYYFQQSSSSVLSSLKKITDNQEDRQNNNIQAQKFDKEIYQKHKKKEKFFIKINKCKKVFQIIEKFERLKSYFTIQNIDKSVQRGKVKLNQIFFYQILENKQPNLKLNNRKGLSTKIQKQLPNMGFVEKIYASNSQISIDSLYKLKGIKQLYLSKNKIKGSVQISEFKSLIILDFSHNEIEEITVRESKQLKQILLSNNRIIKINLIQLNSLERLDIQDNSLIDKQSFNLPALKLLNINYNKISQLNVQYSSKLQFLYCKKRQQSIMSTIFHQEVQFLQIISVKNIINNNGFSFLEKQKLQQLALEISYQHNYKYIFTHIFKNLRQIVLRFKNFEKDYLQKNLQDFLINQKNIKDIQLIFNNCSIKSLNLQKLQHLQRLVLWQQNTKIIKQLTLNSVSNLTIYASLVKLYLNDWSKLQIFQVDKLKIPQQNRNFQISQQMKQVHINDSQILNNYSFQRLRNVKQILIHSKKRRNTLSCRQNNLLKKIDYELDTRQIVIDNCPSLQYVKLSSSPSNEIDLLIIDLSQLKILILDVMKIDNLTLALTTNITTIKFKDVILTNKLKLNVYQNDINLQELSIQDRHFQQISNMMRYLNKITKVTFYFKELFSIQTSQICSQIIQLRFTVNKEEQQEQNSELIITNQIEIVVDSLVTLLYLPRNAEFISLKISNNKNKNIYIRQDDEEFMKLARIGIVNIHNVNLIFQISTDRIESFQKLFSQRPIIRDLKKRIY